MPDLRVEKGAIARLDRVDGDLRVDRGARITAKGDLLTVVGGAFFEGDASIDCDFSCGSLTVERGEIKVAGDLTVAKGMDVAHAVKVAGAIKAGEVEVGGKLVATSVSCGGTVRVGGLVEVAEALEADSVDVGGKVVVGGAVKLRELGVGGYAQVGGGTISGHAKVGGIFESTAPLEFGEIQVYGKCTLPAACKGMRIATSGKLSVGGDFSCEEIEVGGVARVRGNCGSRRVTINGKLDVSGSLSASEKLENYGSGEAGGDFTGGDLHVGGKFKARKAVLENEAEILGEIETVQGTKAKLLVVGSGSRCRGALVGGRVELARSKLVMGDWDKRWAGQAISLKLIGRQTNAEDVYGDEVVLGPHTRCGRVFARTVELGAGCVVEQVTYTEEVRRGHHAVHMERPTDKVEKLPPFPL
jgi:cytoskeletal protein CcmA (bactofilin family)